MKISHSENSCLLLCMVLIVVQVVVSCQTDHKTSHPMLLRVERLMSERPDSALLLLEDSIDVSRLSGKNYADWCLLLTQARDKEYVVHTSDSLIRVALEYYEDGKDPERLMLTWYYMGRVSQDMNDAVRAQEYYLKALEAGSHSENVILKAKIYNNLGMLYTYQDAYDSALPMLKKALDCLRQIGDSISQSFVLRDIARTYHQLKDLDQALSYYQEAIVYAHPNNQASIYNETGGLLLDKKEYSKALPYLYAALASVVIPSSYEPVCLTLGEAHFRLGSIDSARYYLNKSAGSEILQTKTASFSLLYRLERQENNLKAYALAQEQHEKLRDSIRVENYNATLLRLQSLYDYQLIENRAMDEALRHAITQRNLSLAVGSAVFILAVLIGCCCYIYIQRKELKKQNMRYLQFVEEKEKGKEKDRKKKEKTLVMKAELDRFVLSDLYRKFAVTAKSHKDITEEELKEMEKHIAKIYPGLRSSLKRLDPAMSEKCFYLCYLTVLGIKPSRIGTLLDIRYISKERAKLYQKLTGKKGAADDFDKLIKSLLEEKMESKTPSKIDE